MHDFSAAAGAKTYLRVLSKSFGQTAKKLRIPRNLRDCDQDRKIDVQSSGAMRAVLICVVAVDGNR